MNRAEANAFWVCWRQSWSHCSYMRLIYHVYMLMPFNEYMGFVTSFFPTISELKWSLWEKVYEACPAWLRSCISPWRIPGRILCCVISFQFLNPKLGHQYGSAYEWNPKIMYGREDGVRGKKTFWCSSPRSVAGNHLRLDVLYQWQE